ncbi:MULTISPECIES: hypothetical protein [Delftia]|uniref:Fur family transcriptional regulator n=3 Tax=Delftia TaxID=80865 RepID=A0ABM6EA96_9BURK|nr:MULTISPECIES: hypothetical protein [Delftia]AOV04468.1 hypothetical protein BI380_25635 [Delftia tsuruhatensis]MDH0421475.1 Fur family transcriptional regulator [Delftia tsuruhatensis]MDH2230963.1 Fur family transcriptional regulator [Delftia tsuruhatensis]QFS63573.1 Fur family transcriptional regulator [Delftia tsuruhatensis]WAT86395.1 Fur family transcriptional regulator [Delftia acidovorans]
MMAKRSKRIVTPANDLLARAGVRYKPSAAAMLALLLEQPELALTHTEFEQALAQRGVCVNRVTLYRWLERLVAAEVLEKRSDDVDRTWRFSLRSAQPGMSLLRFECDACRRHFNLPEASEGTKEAADQILYALSKLGHVGHRVDFSIHGRCVACVLPKDSPTVDHPSLATCLAIGSPLLATQMP